jgi:hypothetical protein
VPSVGPRASSRLIGWVWQPESESLVCVTDVQSPLREAALSAWRQLRKSLADQDAQ